MHVGAQKRREEEGNSVLEWPGREQLELASQGRLHGGGKACSALWKYSGLMCSGSRGKQVTGAAKLHPDTCHLSSPEPFVREVTRSV